MVAEDRAGENCAGHTGGKQHVAGDGVAELDGERGHDGHRAPGRTGRERDEAGADENQQRQKSGRNVAADIGRNEVAKAHALGDRTEGPREHENRAGHAHELEAVDDGGHGLFKRHDLGGKCNNDAGDCHAERAPIERELRVARIKDSHEAGTGAVRVGDAGVKDAADDDHESDGNGEHEAADHGLGLLGLAEFGTDVQHGLGSGRDELALGERANLSLEHRAVVAAGVHHHADEDERQDGVHVERQAVDVSADGGDALDAGGVDALADHTDLVGDPVGDEQRCRGSRCGVEHVGELFRRNAVILADIAEHVAVDRGDQAVVHGAQHTEAPGTEAHGTSLFESSLGRLRQREAAAKSPDKRDAHSHKEREHEQDHVIRHVVRKRLQRIGDSAERVPSADDQRTGKESGEHGHQHLLGRKAQRDRNHGGDQGQ